MNEKEIEFTMNIPCYKASITCLEDGIFDISLVDLPAVESNWLAFNKQEQPLQFKIENEEEHIITGVIMRCDFPIYRFDEFRGEYYILYDRETIELMAQKMMVDGTYNTITLMHQEGSEVEGVELLEIYLKNTERGISPKGFEDIEEHSLFATYKVNNPEIWSKVKDGTFKGFSLSGFFDVRKIEEDKNTKNTHMSAIENKIIRTFVKFGEITTNNGTLYWIGEQDLTEGTEVYIGEDTTTPAPDGEYKTEDGKTIKVAEGKVVEIVDPEAEVAPEVEEQMEQKEEMVEETVTETTTTEETTEPKNDEVTELKAELESIKEDIENLRNTVEALLEEVRKPVTPPVTEEFSMTEKREVRGNAARIVSAFKK